MFWKMKNKMGYSAMEVLLGFYHGKEKVCNHERDLGVKPKTFVKVLLQIKEKCD